MEYFLSICNADLKYGSYKIDLFQHWTSHNVKHFSRKKQHAYNHALTTALPSDWSKYYDLKRQCQRNVIEHLITLVNHQEIVFLH